MKRKLTSLLGICSFILLVSSCTDDIDRTLVHYSDSEFNVISQRLNLPAELYEYGQDQSNFINLTQFNNQADIFGTGNELQNHKATLGRVLFYDEQLSINNTIACASCHIQEKAFADNEVKSTGFDGETAFRNSLSLGNTVGFEVAYGGGGDFGFPGGQQALFGWDEANLDISSQSQAAITSTVEMGMHDMGQLKSKLTQLDYYQVLFKKAFENNKLSSEQILGALDAFVNSISSNNSRFDKEAMSSDDGITNVFKDFDGFTKSENNGKTLYLNNCASCHSTDHSFTAIARANNGLNINYADKGVGANTTLSRDMGVFKVPFLRNIAKTGPYMHDGRFESLAEVVDFYSNNIKSHANLHHFLKDGSVSKKFDFSNKEKSDLIAYLHTLTDPTLLSEVKWSDPFK